MRPDRASTCRNGFARRWQPVTGLCDRFTVSTAAYQEGLTSVSGLHLELIARGCMRSPPDGSNADLTLWLDLSLELSAATAGPPSPGRSESRPRRGGYSSGRVQ